MKISEIITDKYKLRIPPTVYYELLADVQEVEEEQEPKTGHWIDKGHLYHHYYNDGDIETTDLQCSCCNEEVEWDIELPRKPFFCENCGAKMVELQKSE